VSLQIAARAPGTAGRVQKKSVSSITGTKLLCMNESCRLWTRLALFVDVQTLGVPNADGMSRKVVLRSHRAHHSVSL
jgi:hypothetical protein